MGTGQNSRAGSTKGRKPMWLPFSLGQNKGTTKLLQVWEGE